MKFLVLLDTTYGQLLKVEVSADTSVLVLE